MYRKLPRLDKSEQRGFKQTKRPQRGQKCCQRVERNRSPSPIPAGGPVAKPEITRSGRVPHFLAPVKRGWSPTSLGRGAWGVTSLSSHSVAPDRWPLSRHSPLPPLATLRSPRVHSRRPEIGFVFPLDPAFVRRKSLCTSD